MKTLNDRPNTGRLIDRRSLIAGIGAVSLVPGNLWAQVAAQVSNPDPFLITLCDLVFPDTDTKGAVAAKVPEFLGLAIAHGLRDAPPNLQALLEQELNRAAGGNFMPLPAAAKAEILTAVDHSSLVNHVPSQWPVMKELIALGYYTSEIGGSEEMKYELVPGEWDPDLPLKPGDRAYSSEWTGVQYS